MAKNMVIAGDFKGDSVYISFLTDEVHIGNFNVNKQTIANIEIVDEDSRKSAASALGRAAVGAIALGGIGIVAGLTGKNKKSYTLSVEFKSGERSLIEVDEKIYKRIITIMY